MKSPIRPSSSQAKTGPKSPPVPTTPKSAPPPPPKKTPTSVLDYFGMGTIHRSDKKLVASTKRKAVSSNDFSATTFTLIKSRLGKNSSVPQPTQDSDDLISDEEMARQLQMEEELEVGRPAVAL